MAATTQLKSVDPGMTLFTHLNAQFNFSSGQPLLVTSMARRNSLKSIEPFLSVSKVLENDGEKTD